MSIGIDPISMTGLMSKKRQAGVCENPNFEACDATLVSRSPPRPRARPPRTGERKTSSFLHFFFFFLFVLTG